MPSVTIIGSGPAGSATAIRLARAGWSVRLFDKERFPRAKLCGGFMSPESLEELEDLGILKLLREAGAIPIHRTVIASRKGTILESALPKEALSVSRYVLDNLLRQQAQACHAELHTNEDGFHQKVADDYTVVAAGRSNDSDRLSDHKPEFPWYARSKKRYFGVQAIFDDVQGITDQVELDLVESGYVGLARQKEGVNVCALTTHEAMHTYGPSLDRLLAHFMEENPILSGHLRGSRRTNAWLAVGPVELGIRHLTGDHTFFVGDAACVMDPFAGEGMSMALYGSRILAAALQQKSEPPDSFYRRLWHQAFDPALRWNAIMRLVYSVDLLREPSFHGLRWLSNGVAHMTSLTRYRPIQDLDEPIRLTVA